MTMMGFDSDGQQVVFMRLVKKEFFSKNVQRECETCLGLKLKQLQKEAEGVLASDSGAFKHNALPHKCFQETEQPSEIDVYLIPKYTFRLLGYVYEVVSTYMSVVYTFH